MPSDYDAIVIGTGQAGPALVGRLTKAGMRVAVIERKNFGGTCVNTGCIPTKTLVASAYAAQMVRRAAEYGIKLDGGFQVDMKAVKARKDAVSGESRQGVEDYLRKMKGCTVIEGHGRFESPDEVAVGAERLRSSKIFINVGGRAQIPETPGLEEVGYLTNSSMMDVDYLPEHLIVAGGGYVGLEFAQMYRRFGSRVTIVQRSKRLLPREDEDVSKSVREILEGEGIQVLVNTEFVRFRKEKGQTIAGLSSKNQRSEIAGSDVLIATGRVPNTDDLSLEKAGIELDKRGYIPVDDYLRTKVEGIWALGDCNGKGAFTHTSYNDFEIVAANLLDNDSRKVSDRIAAHAVFIDPPLGRVGMSSAEAVASGRRVLAGERPMSHVRRAVEKGEPQGFMRILVDAGTREILGATILGTGGDEAIHCILDMMYAKAPYTALQRAMHIHPTVSELIPTILGEMKPLAGV